MAIEVGDVAPEFELKNQFGEVVKLTDYRGKSNVVLLFYPKAFTGTCTAELCAIRDDRADFVTDSTVTLGVSCDSPDTLKAFAESQGYDFNLLSDWWPHGATAQAYGVFLEERGFALRATFIIDKQGVVRWKVVNSPADARSNSDYRAALAEIN